MTSQVYFAALKDDHCVFRTLVGSSLQIWRPPVGPCTPRYSPLSCGQDLNTAARPVGLQLLREMPSASELTQQHLKNGRRDESLVVALSP